jgi:streptogramin lyase
LNIKFINAANLTSPQAGVYINGTIWVGDLTNGIINITEPNETPVYPETPAGLANGEGIYVNQEILVAAGKSSDQSLQFAFKDGFYSFKNDSWKSFNATNFSAIDSFKGLVSIAYIPASGSVFAGADHGGLLEITKENKAILYKQNSFLAPVFNQPLRYSIGGLATDRDQHLWLTNNGASQGLIVLKQDGAVQKFTVPFSYTNFGLSKLIVDDQNRKWIIAANADGLFCFDHGSSVENTADDKWRQFRQGLGRGNLPSNKVTSIAVDRNGFIWVGTDKGIAVIQCGDDLFSTSVCEAILPVVQQDNFAGRLLADEQINDIEVDGADRKWIATNNGVWLLSADGQQVVHRFTSSNSKLLNNEVASLVIHQETGEVFFMTQKGICSYRGTAIKPVEVMKKPFVFPNPVPPGFSGAIAIRDLPENAWVSITELDGRVVYKTRSLGGQAIWNGKNYKGERVSSGTYLIIVSNEFNTQQVAGKIFFLK